MSELRLNRRTFLRLGALGGAATLLPRRFASAQPPPPRFLLLYRGAGWTPRQTFFRPSFAPAAWGSIDDIYHIANSDERAPDDGRGTRINTRHELAEYELDLMDARLTREDMSPVLAPFWDVRHRMNVYEGLACLSTGWDPHGDAHAKNHLAIATGGPAAVEDGVKSRAMYPSLDQRLLAYLRESDPLAYALSFAPNQRRSSGTDGFHYFLYGDDGSGTMARLPTEGDPAMAFTRLFGGLEDDGGDEEARLAAQAEVFRRLDGRFADLSSRMGTRDQVVLDAHRANLASLSELLARPRATCEPPTLSLMDGDRAEQIISDTHAFQDIIASAFGCGLTRVASLRIDVPPEAYGAPDSADIHHDYEHPSDPGAIVQGDEAALRGEALMTDRNVLQSQIAARMISRLESIPEGEGSLLDNTIVLYVSELAHGNHGSENFPFVTFGGAGAFETGRYLKYPHRNPNPWNRNYRNEWTGVPHSGLYISLLRAMGMDIDYIHAPSIDGSVPHESVSGTIDMSGPLERL